MATEPSQSKIFDILGARYPKDLSRVIRSDEDARNIARTIIDASDGDAAQQAATLYGIEMTAAIVALVATTAREGQRHLGTVLNIALMGDEESYGTKLYRFFQALFNGWALPEDGFNEPFPAIPHNPGVRLFFEIHNFAPQAVQIGAARCVEALYRLADPDVVVNRELKSILGCSSNLNVRKRIENLDLSEWMPF